MILGTVIGATVHPHGRGEHIAFQLRISIDDGSSPRAWEHHAGLLEDIDEHGSSPRAWGTLRARLEPRSPCRFIPTGVGNTVGVDGRQNRTTVHPHGRGEHHGIGRARLVPNGSSPRAWGTHSSGCPRPDRRRFIPTGVGNTAARRPRNRCPSVHPHGRGEHLAWWTGRGSAPGSSPRAWGTLRLRREFHSSAPVHPHGRGEHEDGSDARFGFVGSSPRAWGTHAKREAAGGVVRFIPTGVGNTRKR